MNPPECEFVETVKRWTVYLGNGVKCGRFALVRAAAEMRADLNRWTNPAAVWGHPHAVDALTAFGATVSGEIGGEALDEDDFGGSL